jgi:hypothetical protein
MVGRTKATLSTLVILSDTRRNKVTERESKDPEDMSSIHTVSGSSHKNSLQSVT